MDGYKMTKMETIGIIYNPMIAAAQALTGELERYLNGAGVTNWVCSAWEVNKAEPEVDGTDLVLSVGGDGTILRALQAVVTSRIPIIGINLGKLGFMTELAADEAFSKLPEIIGGAGWIDERTMIEVQLSTADESGENRRYYALNDVVVARGAIARMVSIEVSIDDEPLTVYKADGVIIATATGSTGYAMAAGGPVLNPEAREFLLVPMLPHLGSSYPLVLPASASVELRVCTPHQATLSVDGNINLPLSDGATIAVRHSQITARFLRVHPRTSFYSTLEQKLKGKK